MTIKTTAAAALLAALAGTAFAQDPGVQPSTGTAAGLETTGTNPGLEGPRAAPPRQPGEREPAGLEQLPEDRPPRTYPGASGPTTPGPEGVVNPDSMQPR